MHGAWGDRSQLIASMRARAIAQDFYDPWDRARQDKLFLTIKMEGTVLIAIVGGLFLSCLFLYGLAATRRRKLRSAIQVLSIPLALVDIRNHT